MADETNVQVTETTATEQEKTFTQADVDALVQRRLDRERKKYPSEDELSAFRSWKESQQTEQERWNNLTKERDESRAALSAAQAELEQLKREKYVLSKGLSGDEAEFIAFKAAKMVNDKTTLGIFAYGVRSLRGACPKGRTLSPVPWDTRPRDAGARKGKAYLSPAPQALPQAVGFSVGLSPAPQALPQAEAAIVCWPRPH